MNSSTSSSEVRRWSPRKWLAVFGGVLFVVLAVFAAVNCLFASRPKVLMDLEERQLTACKIFSPERYDMVASGSSRINYGIDPESMRPFLPGLRIYNCAMFGGAVNREILDYLEARKIDWSAPGGKIVLIEFSPRAMFAERRTNGSYRSMLGKSPDEIRGLLNYSSGRRFSLDNLFIPMNRDRWNMRRAPRSSTVPHCHMESGWYEVVNISETPEEGIAKRLKNAERAIRYPKNYEIDKSLNEILERTRAWSARGVMVFGVEPPIAPEVRALEERLSNYNRAEAVARFREAGGIFLPVSDSSRVMLGGSHLDSVEARKFSREVAEKIARHLRRTPEAK